LTSTNDTTYNVAKLWQKSWVIMAFG
jgi:hypothetical protein